MNMFSRGRDRIEPVAAGTVTVRVRSVDAERSGRRVLTSIDLDVVGGEVLALVGPNGAGKSTLLAVLAGELHPTSGSVEVHGRPSTSWTTMELARRRAVLPQQHTVGFGFTAEQVVRMGRSPWNRTSYTKDDDVAVAEALLDCDVARFAHRPFAALSGGERARVSLARVLAQRTSTVLLDEPTAALDIGHQEAVMSLARAHASKGNAVVVVLHDLALAASYADRVAVLHEGAVDAVGTPRSVFDAPRLTRVYGHPVEVFDHPDTGALLVLPVRSHRPAGSDAFDQ